ncbi:MAG TPA: ABC transporter ATP-binding protein, partial [Accumulibacter sp.]|nr:ABC transporter ATP-binding protein [Accumulibacter sp.]
DRAFLDDVVTQTIAPQGDGRWREYAGGYQEWADHQTELRRQEAQTASAVGRRDAAPSAAAAAASRQKAVPAGRLSWKEARELAELPGKIAALEAEQRAIGEKLADPLFYRSQGSEVQRLSDRLNEIDDQLLALLERWEALEA